VKIIVNVNNVAASRPATHNGVKAEIETGNANVAVHKYMMSAVRD
jgi:hypothetical protein